MKRIPVLLVLALCAAATLRAEDQWVFKGTVIKMQMTECIASTGFKVAMGGRPASAGSCPEYIVMSPKVVYVMVGRHTDAFIPLAENLDFVVQKNEILISETSKSRFVIRQMTLRSDWEREEERKELMAKALERSVTYELRNPPRGTLTAAR
jgi:hypothetical protein